MLKTKAQALEIAALWKIADPVILFGYRSATSKYGQYDDVLALLTPTDYREYKGNTLPSKGDKGIAVLQPGAYSYRQDLHGISHLRVDALGNLEPADKVIHDWLMAHKGEDFPNPDGRLLPYWAYRQNGPVMIRRIGSALFENFTDPSKWPMIDLHKGGYNLTSSLGCQTFYPDHWDEVRRLGYAAMDEAGMKSVTYILHQE